MKGKQSRKVLILVGSIILMLLTLITASTAGCTPKAEGQVITLVFTCHEPPGGLWEKDFYMKWFSDLEQRSGGRVKVEAHWNAELVPLQDAFDAVLKGNVDMAHIMQAQVPGVFPMDEMLTFTTYDQYCYRRDRVHWELIKEFPEMQKAYSQVKLLWVGAFHSAGIGTTKKTIKTLEDAKGLKLITYGEWASKRMEALGLTPVSMPPSDMVPSLQTGVLDGVFIALFSLDEYRLGDLLKHIVLVNMTNPLFGTVMNLDKWNSLPDDIKKIIDEESETMIDWGDEIMARSDQAQLQTSPAKYGIEYYKLPPEEVARWVALDKPVLDAFTASLNAKGLPGTKLRDEYLRLEKKYSASEYAFK